MQSPKYRTTFQSLSTRDTDDATALSASYGYADNEDPLAPNRESTAAGDEIADNKAQDSNQQSQNLEEVPAEQCTTGRCRQNSDIDITYINETVDRFLKSLQEPKYRNPLTGDEISELFQAFYKQIEEELELPGKMLSKSEQAQKKRTNAKILDVIEKTLCGTLYQKLFEPFGLDAQRSSRFDQRLACLRSSQQLLDKLELDISPEIRPSLEPVIGYLSNIDKAKAPQEKIYCIVLVNKMIVDVFKDSSNVCSDSILPVLVYCVLASPASKIWRHTIYMRRFRRESAIKGHVSYCLTNMEAAVQFLDTVTIAPEDLPPDVDPALFQVSSRANSVTSRSRSSSDARMQTQTTPIRTRIGSIGASVGTSVSKYLFAKLQAQQPSTIADVRRTFDSDTTSVSTGDADSYVGMPLVNPKFINIEADALTIGDVKALLQEYKRLANHVQGNYL